MALSKKLREALKANLMEELYIKDLSLDEQLTMLEDIGEIISKNVAMRIFEELPDEQASALEKAIMDTSENPEQTEEFFRKEFPDFDEIVMEEIASYKKKLLDRFAKA